MLLVQAQAYTAIPVELNKYKEHNRNALSLNMFDRFFIFK